MVEGKCYLVRFSLIDHYSKPQFEDMEMTLDGSDAIKFKLKIQTSIIFLTNQPSSASFSCYSCKTYLISLFPFALTNS